MRAFFPTALFASALWAAVRQPDVSDALRQRVAGTSSSHQRIQPRELLEMPVRDVRRLDSVVAQAISGLGGVGKSQLAARYTQRHAADYEVVAWIDAADGGTADLLAFAKTLGINIGSGIVENAIERVLGIEGEGG